MINLLFFLMNYKIQGVIKLFSYRRGGLEHDWRGESIKNKCKKKLGLLTNVTSRTHWAIASRIINYLDKYFSKIFVLRKISINFKRPSQGHVFHR